MASDPGGSSNNQLYQWALKLKELLDTIGTPPWANSALADMAQSRIKGRAAGAGTGSPQDLTPQQVMDIQAGTAAFFDTIRFNVNVGISSTDLNNLDTAGFYIGNSLTNAPDTTNWWYVFVQTAFGSGGAARWINQFAWNMGAGGDLAIFWRTAFDTGSARAWNGWQRVWTNGAFGNMGGNRVLLNRLTANNSATIADTTSFTSIFSRYEIVIKELIPVTTGAIRLRVNSGGVKTTGYLSTHAYSTGNTTGNVINPAETTFIPLTGTAAGHGAQTATPGLSGTLMLTSPAAAGAKHIIGGPMIWLNGNGTMSSGVPSGMWNTAGAVTGIELSCNAGNLNTGDAFIYGVFDA